MKAEIKGGNFPVAICQVEANSSVRCQKGAMAWMSPNMEMQTKGGGIGKMFSKALSGEAMFHNIYTAQGGPGMLAMGSSFPGDILVLDVTNNPIIAQKHAFLACETSVDMKIQFQRKLGAGFFGGEGFIMQSFSGNGKVILEVDGSVITYDLGAGESILVDTGCLALMTASCRMDIESVKGIGTKLLGGEGFFNTRVTGPGRVWLQSMPSANLVSGMVAGR